MLRQLFRIGLALPRIQVAPRFSPIASVRHSRYFSSELSSDWPDSIKTFLDRENIKTPTAIQEMTLPPVMENKDLVGIARTGSGKTLAFVIPAVIKILNSRKEEPVSPRASRKATCLVLAPTRELADQIGFVFNKFSGLDIETLLLVGGASRSRQVLRLERANQDVYVATPGRLIDLLNDQLVDLSGIKYLVLDEADRMLDMGFEPQIRKILETIPDKRQTLMWSATWPEEIKSLAEEFMKDYSYVAVDSETLKANPSIDQKFIINHQDKLTKLLDIVDEGLKENPNFKCLIFTNTKQNADRLERILLRNRYKAIASHGGKSQNNRDDAVRMFRSGRCNIMVATDVAARGLDINDINLVVNYDFPNRVEDYIHRIGRTARHNNKGVSITFFSDQDASHAKKLISVLEETNQHIPDELHYMTPQKSNLSSKQFKYGNRQDNYNRRSYGSERYNTGRRHDNRRAMFYD